MFFLSLRKDMALMKPSISLKEQFVSVADVQSIDGVSSI